MTYLSRPAPEEGIPKTVPGEPLIAFKDVRIGFDEGDVLQGISFEVWPGETKVLLGESGSGKTLIMKMAAGLLRPDEGRIWVMGHELSEMKEQDLLDFRRHVGFVFQEGALFDSLTVAENVAFRLREESVAEDEIETRVREALRFVELEATVDQYPGELSGGMRRRVSIARALVDRPPLVFYDSPTAGLDPVTSQTIIMLVLRGRDLQGVTSLLATHRVQDAFGLAAFRLEPSSGRLVRVNFDGQSPVQGGAKQLAAPAAPATVVASAPTNVLVLRGGRVYFEGHAAEMLHSSDEYLKKFLASAE
ncbi:MAG: ATP-binding cassette domain-containing protein [Candidatus Acidiferrales bacterium]|jgi:phospholipid/cholesterol/gamma-HCH transport system ATP-binding protein